LIAFHDSRNANLRIGVVSPNTYAMRRMPRRSRKIEAVFSAWTPCPCPTWRKLGQRVWAAFLHACPNAGLGGGKVSSTAPARRRRRLCCNRRAAYIAGRWSIKPQPPTEVVDTQKSANAFSSSLSAITFLANPKCSSSNFPTRSLTPLRETRQYFSAATQSQDLLEENRLYRQTALQKGIK